MLILCRNVVWRCQEQKLSGQQLSNIVLLDYRMSRVYFQTPYFLISVETACRNSCFLLVLVSPFFNPDSSEVILYINGEITSLKV